MRLNKRFHHKFITEEHGLFFTVVCQTQTMLDSRGPQNIDFGEVKDTRCFIVLGVVVNIHFHEGIIIKVFIKKERKTCPHMIKNIIESGLRTLQSEPGPLIAMTATLHVSAEK